MFERNDRRSQRLQNIKLSLSKFDAKYSKSSELLDYDDSSDNFEEENEMTAPRTFIYQNHDDDSSEKICIPTSASNFAPTMAQSIEDELSASPQNLKDASLIEEKSTSEETVSSMHSVKTDSMLGLHNVHSVSSLAGESIFPHEIERRDAPVFNVLSPLRQEEFKNPQSDLSVLIKTKLENHLLSSSRKKSEEELCSPVENRNFINEKLPTKSLSPPIEIQTTQSECSSSVEGKNFTPTETYQTSDGKVKSHFIESQLQESVKLNKDKGSRKMVTVAVQTSFKLRDEKRLSQHVRSRPMSTSVEERLRNLPVMKAVRIPHFLKDSHSRPPLHAEHDQLEGESYPIPSEIPELLSFHLHLTEKFLQCQHKIYIANCRAVQMLERGYRENAEQKVCKCLKRKSTVIV